MKIIVLNHKQEEKCKWQPCIGKLGPFCVNVNGSFGEILKVCVYGDEESLSNQASIDKGNINL